MTRSILSAKHPKLAKKAFRAEAKAQGLKFAEACELRAKERSAEKFLQPQGLRRRNYGRMDGTHWNGKTFICPAQVDAAYSGTYNICDCESCLRMEAHEDYWPDEEKAPVTATISLLDIAKPAKVKGVAKEFEVIDRLPRVIALQDDEDAYSTLDWDTESEAWENMYDSESEMSEADFSKVSYATVLQGRDREKRGSG